jgi:hypothetical protein
MRVPPPHGLSFLAFGLSRLELSMSRGGGTKQGENVNEGGRKGGGKNTEGCTLAN